MTPQICLFKDSDPYLSLVIFKGDEPCDIRCHFHHSLLQLAQLKAQQILAILTLIYLLVYAFGPLVAVTWMPRIV